MQQNIRIPTAADLAADRRFRDRYPRALYIFLFGLAAGRIDAGFNEGIDEAVDRLVKGKLGLSLPGEKITVGQFAETISALQSAIAEYGERTVLEKGLLEVPASITKHSCIFPEGLSSSLAAWQSEDKKTRACVFTNFFNALPFRLALEGRPTTVSTGALGFAPFWQLAAKATDLPIKAFVFALDELSGLVGDLIDERGDCFFFGPFARELVVGSPYDKKDLLAERIRSLLPFLQGRIAAICEPATAYAAKKALPEFRSALLESQRLYAAASFPANMLDWASNDMLALFIDNSSAKHETVRFADFTDEALYSRSAKRRTRVINDAGKESLQKLLTKAEDAPGQDVDLSVIRSNSTLSLVPAAYLLDNHQAEDICRIESFPLRLSDVAEIIRPTLRASAEAGRPVHEATASDITDFGRVELPKTVTLVPEEKATEAFVRTILKKRDIVFCTKGSVGKCGLVVEEPKTPWTIGQMCVAIRLKPEAPISAVALWRYLRSFAFRNYLTQIVPALGMQNRIVFMSPKEVEQIPVPKLSEEQNAREDEAFEAQEELIAQLRKLAEEAKAADLHTLPDDWQ